MRRLFRYIRITEWRKEAAQTARQADAAEDKADQALVLANQAISKIKKAEDDAKQAVKDRKADRKWFVGIMVPIVLALVPIITRFYFN